jgi:hypothetical protein
VKKLQQIGFIAAALFAFTSVAYAQPDLTKSPSAGLVPLRVQVTISKYRDEKKLSSMPYTLTLTSNDRGTLRSSVRVISQVPVPSTTFAPTEKGEKPAPLASYSYRDVGTSIDATAMSVEGGLFRLEITVDDSSVSEGTSTPGPPSFRTFRSSNQLVLRDGQSIQYTSATDKLTGEVVRIDITLTAIK